MEGLIYLLNQAGVALAQLEAQLAEAKKKVEELEKALADPKK